MPESLRCSRCGSDDVMPRVRVVERAEDGMRHDLQAEVVRRPNALFFKRPHRADLTARVCGACGFVELYVDAPGALYTAFLQADSNPAVSAPAACTPPAPSSANPTSPRSAPAARAPDPPTQDMPASQRVSRCCADRRR